MFSVYIIIIIIIIICIFYFLFIYLLENCMRFNFSFFFPKIAWIDIQISL